MFLFIMVTFQFPCVCVQFSFVLGFLGISFAQYIHKLYAGNINKTGNKVFDEVLDAAFVGMPGT